MNRVVMRKPINRKGAPQTENPVKTNLRIIYFTLKKCIEV
jgi:hypothetical protein